GLPTAFRLGAELILTKPVAKDQARSTIRAAVSRVRKDVPASESVPAPAASAAFSSPVTPSAATSSPVTPGAIMPDGRAHAAAAAASSHAVSPHAVAPQMTSFAEPAPSFVPSAIPTTLSAPAVKAVMHSAVEEIAAPVAPAPAAPKVTAPAVSAHSKSTRPLVPSDDPVLRELEDSELAASELEASNLQASELKASDQPKAAPPRRAAEPAAPVFSSYQQKQKPRGSLVALLILVLAAGGFYAAWMYQPGFRDIAQPQIDRVLALAGMAHPQQSPSPAPAANPVKPPAPPAPATTSATAPESSTAAPNQTASAIPDSATSSAAATASVPPAATPTAAGTSVGTTAGTGVAPPTSKAANTVPEVAKADASKPGDSKKEAAAASSDSELPGESSAIILSSKGAEKRLVRSTPPKYPAAARASGADGTVVLKAVVNESGKVEGLRLVEGDATLAAAAIQAVKQWRYRPYVRNGQAQPFQTVVIVDFQRP
ncbi:MAG: energy transducer TonB, partial [Terriglobales bacterium]